jgi:hypothetical protein
MGAASSLVAVLPEGVTMFIGLFTQGIAWLLLGLLRVQDASVRRKIFDGGVFLVLCLIVLLVVAIFADDASTEGASRIFREVF